MRCATCQAEMPAGAKFCPACAAPLASDAETMEAVVRRYRPPSSSSASAEEGRFPPGHLLVDRYRVISLVGRGGMGEVYRASDLTLNQPVALKFLPPAAAGRPDLLERFRGEVRIARQVSHPNVCRIYDIGEVDGAAFISMEYVDGEDLGSLLRRIGHLPSDKGIEIARKLCAGLAAAHARGVLHRDLKPANIMIDSRGQVLIMDFGLAAAANTVGGAEVFSGTPAYMAPEQLAGKEVTERSDIYALGLVLFEVFTGKRAFRTEDRSSVPSAAGASRDVDPAIDRVLARCLDPDPARRPPTALALARMLPGGDPLAEALAAGDTPSPAMVAASEATGTLSVRGAVACMAFVAAGLVALTLMSEHSSILRLTPLPHPPEVLAQKARDVATRLGYVDPIVDDSLGWNYRGDYHAWARRNLKPEEYLELIRRGQPSVIYIAYRQSPQYLESRDPSGRISPNDPPINLPGMVRVQLDPSGRLTNFLAVPPQQDSSQAASPPVDWAPLFDAAALDRSRWTEATSQEIPPVGFDARTAWTGTYAHAPDMPMRIEAASWQGRPVSFELFGPWRQPVRVARPTVAQTRQFWIMNLITALLLLGAAWLAWRNYRGGRGDVDNTVRLAAIGFAGQSLSGIVGMHHVPTPREFAHVVDAIGFGLVIAAMAGVFYLALEPFVRRRWPQALISWTRLLAGSVRDPLVGGHILLGVTLGVALAIVQNGFNWYQFDGAEIAGPNANRIVGLDAARMASFLLSAVIQPAAIVMGALFFVILLRLALRSTVMAAVGVIAVSTLAAWSGGGSGAAVLVSLFTGSLGLWVTLHFGILPGTLMVIFSSVTGTMPLTSDLSAWYAGRGVFVVALTLALATWGFRHALAGRKVLSEAFLDA